MMKVKPAAGIAKVAGSLVGSPVRSGGRSSAIFLGGALVVLGFGSSVIFLRLASVILVVVLAADVNNLGLSLSLVIGVEY